MRVLKQAYQLLYRSGLKLADALARIEREIPDENTLHLVEFIRGSKRGIARESGHGKAAPEEGGAPIL
jgi:UDP-N-acetylglucosamine acyltransferase